MKAAFIRKTGGPEVIEYGDIPKPKISEGKLLVKTLAVAPAHVDTYIRAGKIKSASLLQNPLILGRDVIGEVVEVGPDVTEFRPGEIVWSCAFGEGEQGSFAEFVLRDAELFYHLPEGIDPKIAIASLHSAATACRGIIVAAALKKDEILFVNGGAGNIGTALIQLGKARGARVFASSTGKEKMAWCKEQGAEKVFDYQKPGMEEEVKKAAPHGVDVFWDTSQNPHIELGVNLLSIGGRIVLFSGADARPTLPVGPLFRKSGSIKGFSLMHATPDELGGYALIINRAFEEGILKAKIAATLPLSETKKAHAMLEGNELWGKIVITP